MCYCRKRKIRVIVAGGRDFDDYAKLKAVLDATFADRNQSIEIVSGHAKGADMLGERYAFEKNIPCKVFPAEWNKYPIRAGFIRNSQMTEYAMRETPMLIAFWNGTSHGTADTIEKAKKANIECVIVHYDSSSPEEKSSAESAD